MGITKILVCIMAIPFVIILLVLSRALSKDIFDPVTKEYIPDLEGKMLGAMGFIGSVIVLWALYMYVY